MSEDGVLSAQSVGRHVFASVLGVVVAAAGVAVWYWLKVYLLDVWVDLSLVFMPLVIGVAVGWVVRRCNLEESLRLAHFAVAVTLLASLSGIALQGNIIVTFWLRKYAAAAYEETLAYAQATEPVLDDEHLRGVMASQEVAVIGRLAARETTEQVPDYWARRNLLHIHGSPRVRLLCTAKAAKNAASGNPRGLSPGAFWMIWFRRSRRALSPPAIWRAFASSSIQI